MRVDILTIFPGFFNGPLDYGIVQRARRAGLLDVRVHDLRQWTHDAHRTVDDRPFGGGPGMVMKPEPFFEAVEALLGTSAEQARQRPDTAIVLLSAAGRLFRQPVAVRWSRLAHLVLLCGRYEGVDERVAQHLATEEISIGDFVLSGGELAAAVVLDAVTRLLPGALGNEASPLEESFSTDDSSPGGLLDCPHYTRPRVFRGWAVPEVLLSGHHEQIRRWRRQQALEKTLRNRPDLLQATALTEADRRLLEILQARPQREDTGS
jgi:tRNA (guanine37-N1)-methyltransferase